ncbi:MAG: DNA-binding protein AraC-type [Herbinix sp.]|nr:DNA-binding protein AraC-type [Herbinix sp.]
MDHFKHYINQIPEGVYHSAEVYAGEHIALLMPNKFMSEVTIHTEDYHFVLPIEIPPPIWLGKKEFEFERNKIIVFNPDIDVCCKKNNTITSRYSTITIKKQFLNEVAEDMGFHHNVIFSKVENPSSENIRRAIYNFKREIENYGNQSSMIVDSLSIQIVATILREINSNSNVGRYCITEGDGYVKNAKEYMQGFYNSNISIIDICSEINISPYHFIRLFKEKTGTTPHEYLLNLRIENAKKMIKDNEDNITSIGKKCGFINNSHFSTTFKRLTGVSPVEYKSNSDK